MTVTLRNKIFSPILMAVWIYFTLGVPTTIPPRQLTAMHLVAFAMIPLGAFVCALPGVPIRWFAYMGLVGASLFITGHAYHIKGTAYDWGWHEGPLLCVFPIVIAVVAAAGAAALAALRQWAQRRIGNRG